MPLLANNMPLLANNMPLLTNNMPLLANNMPLLMNALIEENIAPLLHHFQPYFVLVIFAELL